MLRIEDEVDFVMPSVPVNSGAVTLRDLRDLIEATDALPGSHPVLVLAEELRIEILR